MSANLRHREILQLLETQGAVSIRELTKTLYASEATIRRDLAELEREGALKRTYGGARSILDTKDQVPLFIREALDAKAKDELCRQAAALVRDGDTVFLDGSSTTQYLIKYIAYRTDVTLVTYSIKTAELACSAHIKTYCAGGLLLENSLVCTGPKAIDFARSVNTDICFLSCKGMSADGTFSDTSEEETALRRAFMQNASTRVMLMTGNKLGSAYLHTLCHADEIDHLFSDAALPATLTDALRKK